ncbi:glycosyltransferase family 4 protein [Adhaeribacter rhizoryzae]|uniref:Glycosyltransferase family 4 protein n=1 Tax=Adhaeribacter rhizoryzae TaxID=2607907 RepID=A0A5M6DL92_9BACT|nr:glycosyltransferase family 4 protein [Adhaeribacter rhizoryzae]KAA5548317.1 glycosyltransferase family 4 protein [Adhaeribacter rhizoryzae]
MGTDHKPAIVIVDNSVAITGALKAIVNSTSKLTSEFNFLYVLPENSKALPFLQSLQLNYKTIPFIEISKDPVNLVKYFPFLILNGIRLRKIARQHKAKVIHMNDFYNLTGIMAKILGANVVLITHVRFLPQKFMPALANTWAKLNLQFATKIICVSNAVKTFFPKSDKTLVIYDPLPEREVLPSKERLIQQTSPVRLLYLSNFIKGKGQDYALEAFKKAYEKDKSLHLTFAGGDMGLEKNRVFKNGLIEEVTKENLKNVVKFREFVEDVEGAIKEADIVLNFSESESFSLTCLDALFFGTPLIATDCGGPAELFENDKSGLLVPNKNVEAMTSAILQLAKDREKQLAFAKESRRYVREKFNAKNTYLNLGKLYREIVSPN